MVGFYQLTAKVPASFSGFKDIGLHSSSHSYVALLSSIKERIQCARVRAALAVNRELVLLYWGIGREILARQHEEGWGSKVVDRLAKDLRAEFPQMKGLSRTNLLYMRSFAYAWPEEAIVQQAVGQIPWGHNVRLLDLVKTSEERLWYARATIENGWRRNMLALHIEAKLFHRQGKAVTNFQRTLPSPQSDLAHQLLKDPLQLRVPHPLRRRARKGVGGWSCGTHPQVSPGAGSGFCFRLEASIHWKLRARLIGLICSSTL